MGDGWEGSAGRRCKVEDTGFEKGWWEEHSTGKSASDQTTKGRAKGRRLEEGATLAPTEGLPGG